MPSPSDILIPAESEDEDEAPRTAETPQDAAQSTTPTSTQELLPDLPRTSQQVTSLGKAPRVRQSHA